MVHQFPFLKAWIGLIPEAVNSKYQPPAALAAGTGTDGITASTPALVGTMLGAVRSVPPSPWLPSCRRISRSSARSWEVPGFPRALQRAVPSTYGTAHPVSIRVGANGHGTALRQPKYANAPGQPQPGLGEQWPWLPWGKEELTKLNQMLWVLPTLAPREYLIPL